MSSKATVIAAMTYLSKVTKAVPPFETVDSSGKKALIFDFWYPDLQDIPDDLLMAAAHQIGAAESFFFPSLAELRNKAIELKMATLKIPTWGEAWKECLEYINKFTWEQKDGFSHPLVEKAYNQLGGWENLMSDDLPTARAQFRQIYESLLQRSMDDIKLLPESRIVSEKYQLEIGNLVKKLTA
jgi:hypothetical protein